MRLSRVAASLGSNSRGGFKPLRELIGGSAALARKQLKRSHTAPSGTGTQGAEGINRSILSHSKMHCLTCQGLQPPAVRGGHGCCDSSLGPPLTPLYPSTPRFWPPSEAKVINLYNALQWLVAAAHVHSPYRLSATATLTFAPPGSNWNEANPLLWELGEGPALPPLRVILSGAKRNRRIL